MSNDASKDALPENWVSCSIGDITLPVEKVDPRDDPDRVITYIDISGIDNVNNRISDTKSFRLVEAPSRARQIVKAGDVLFSTVRPYLRNIASVPPEFDGEIASTGFSVLRPANEIEHSFLFYKAVSSDFVNALSGQQYGVSYPAVKDEQVRAEPIALPPTEEQTRIVAKIEELFSELDKGIENLKTAREQLKVYRQAVLKHAFEGKLTEQWREENKDKLETADQLLARIKQEREARYEQQLEEWKATIKSWQAEGEPGKKPAKPAHPREVTPITHHELEDMPALPENWAYARFGAVIEDIAAGKSFKCDERVPANNEVGVAKVSAVSWGEYDERESKTCIEPERVNSDLFIRPGDFLFSRANTIDLVGACVIVRKTSKDVMLSDKTLRIVLGPIPNLYFLQYLRSRTGRNEIMKRSTGNQESMRNIGQDRIRNITVPVCSELEMTEIEKNLSEKLTLIEAADSAMEEELVRSEALRHSILKKAFCGHLVEQDPNDEPASVLLERIKAEKASPGKNKKTKNRKDAA